MFPKTSECTRGNDITKDDITEVRYSSRKSMWINILVYATFDVRPQFYII